MDYDALAARFGGTDSASTVDYDALAGKFGGKDVSAQPETSMMQDIGQGAANLVAGAVRGAGSIGSTLLLPWDMGKDLAAGRGLSLQSNKERRHDMDMALSGMGADIDSGLFATGKIGAEVAGTAGVGGLLAKGVTEVAPLIPQLAPYAQKIAAALESGGFRVNPANFVGPAQKATIASRLGNTALRAGSGGAVGATAAGMIDPSQAGDGAMIGAAIPGGVKVAGEVGKLANRAVGSIASNIVGTMTGAGGEALRQAYRSGREGITAFADNMRGKVDPADVLSDAKAALSTMRINRGNEYRSGMVNIKADKSVLDMNPILQEVQNIQSMGSFKGQTIRKNAAGVVDEVANKVQEWANLNPVDFHTPEGLDALKQAIGDIRDTTQFGTAARKAVDSVYDAIKKQITKQAPVYSKVMKNYSEASDIISEVQKALSLGDKASADTAMRKLQSLMRNNVNTNYGNRLELAKELERQGGKELLPSIGGQALNSWTPRGLQALAATGAGVASIANPAMLSALPLQSPRLMGEAAYGAGRLRDLLSRGVDSAASSAGQNQLISRLLQRLPSADELRAAGTVVPSVAYSR